MELISDRACKVRLKSGINGQMTNSGAQHFISGDKRVLPGNVLCSNFTTSESAIDVCLLAGHRFALDGILPQDDTFLTLPEIPLAKYKNHARRNTILQDYNNEQISKLQVIKQADVVLLMNLGLAPFTLDERRANYTYYEARTLHDSFLSLGSHVLTACRISAADEALALFRRSLRIDLDNSDAAKDGIHAASMGGIWQSVVFGFAGVRLEGERLDGERSDGERLDGERSDGERLDSERSDGEPSGGEWSGGEWSGFEWLEGKRSDGGRLDGEHFEGKRLNAGRLDPEHLEGKRLDVGRLDGEHLEGKRLDAGRSDTEHLRLQPCLPPGWKQIEFTLIWRGVLLDFTVARDLIRVVPAAAMPNSTIVYNDEKFTLEGPVEIAT